MDGLDSMLENGPWFFRNNPLILKKWNSDVNLLKEDVNVPVWVKLHGVPMTAYSEDGLSVIASKLVTPLMLDLYTSDMCMQSWGRSSYARAMIELQADVALKDTIMVAMPKLIGEGFYTCIVHDVVKNLKKPSQAPRGVLVGPKVGYKPVKQVYRPKKNNVNTSGNKKKDSESTKEVSNLNPFDGLNSIENDVELGLNGGTSNVASKEANSSRSSMRVMRYGLPRMLKGRQSLLTPNFPKVNYSMLERSTRIAGVTKATLGSEIQNPRRANGVLSYFSLRDEGVAAGSPKDQG
ncbi:reverse transcriptase domain-containing protein [Tanacetum coccineum]